MTFPLFELIALLLSLMNGSRWRQVVAALTFVASSQADSLTLSPLRRRFLRALSSEPPTTSLSARRDRIREGDAKLAPR
jgi:hypothetical protein